MRNLICIVHVFAKVSTFPLTVSVKLLIYCRLAADVRVWRRCSVVVDRCRPDVEGGKGPLIRSIFRAIFFFLSGLRTNQVESGNWMRGRGDGGSECGVVGCGAGETAQVSAVRLECEAGETAEVSAVWLDAGPRRRRK